MAKKKLRDTRIGKVAKAGIYATRLPDYIKFFEASINKLSAEDVAHEQEIESLKRKTGELNLQLDKLKQIQETIGERLSELRKASDRPTIYESKAGSAVAAKSVNDTMADDHSHDKFYRDFEDRFRGSEALIKERLMEYKPYLESLSTAAKKLPVLDLGCGRGEFLKVAEESGLKAVGVDMNKSMIERAKSLGYKAFEDDALSYLSKQKSSVFSVISGFHLVEHIPFPVLLKIFEECYRTVHKDGFVLFETPNPNNLTVGASNFYMDPSHIKPIPPKLLAFATETQGFFAEIIELHPARTEIHHEDPVVEDMMRLLYGPADYAVLASKQPFKLSAK